MPDISQDLQDILNAKYGEEVRGSIHDAIKDINDVCDGNVSTVQGITDNAEEFAETSEAYAKGTVNGTAVESGDVGYEDNSLYYKTQAAAEATLSKSYSQGGTGTRTGEDTDNSKYYKEQAEYWYNQAQSIASQIGNVLKPQGTVTFANLPSLASADAGDMYNISDEFTTTADFVEGAGHVIPLGSNVYKTVNNLWDVLAGSPVTGVKGDSETNYRAGNVNITKANIGLGNVRNVDVGDTSTLTTTNKGIVGAINELDAEIGATNISAIGDGSVTGAINQLNTDLGGGQINIDNYRVAITKKNTTNPSWSSGKGSGDGNMFIYTVRDSSNEINIYYDGANFWGLGKKDQTSATLKKLSSEIINTNIAATYASGVNLNAGNITRNDKMLFLNINIKVTTAKANGDTLFTLPFTNNIFAYALGLIGNGTVIGLQYNNNKIITEGAIPANSYVTIVGTFPIM